MTITTRAAKGAPLTNAELDANFTDLRDLKAPLASPVFTGVVKTNGNFITDDGANGRISLSAEAGSNKLFSTTSGFAAYGPMSYMASAHYFGYGATPATNEAMRVSAAGNLLIGTATDDGANKLQVAGGLATTGNIGVGTAATDAKVAIRGGSGTYSGGITMAASGGNVYALYTTVNDFRLRSVTGGVDALTVTYGGNLLVGTTTDDGVNKLQVTGAIAATNAVSIYGSSAQLMFSNPGGNSGARFMAGLAYKTAAYSGGNFIAAYSDTTYDDQLSIRFYSGSGLPERMRVASGGNLLIGSVTDNGTDKIQANGTVRQFTNSAATMYATIENQATTGSVTNAGIQLATYNGTVVTSTGYLYAMSNSWTYNAAYGANSIGLISMGANGLNLAAGAATAPIKFFAGSETIERMRLASGGNLLLGTTTDNGADKLQVNGSVGVMGGATFTLNSNVGGPNITLADRGTATSDTTPYPIGGLWGTGFRDVVNPAYIAGIDFYRTPTNSGASSAGNIRFFTQDVGDTLANIRANNERMRLTALGNLLLGTTTDNGTDKLQVNGAISSLFVTTANGLKTTSGGFNTTIAGDASGSYLDTQGARAMRFYTNGVEAVRIDASGSLLVGTTGNGGAKLKVLGSGGTLGLSVNSGSATATPVEIIVASNDTTQSALYVYTTANSTFTFKVQSNGNLVNTNNSYGAISDIKLKENVTDATPKLDKLLQVRVVNYSLKADPLHKQLGVIAQELEQVFPGMVDESPDYEDVMVGGETIRKLTGTVTKSVKYSVFVPILIKAMQEQQAQITALQSAVAELQSRI